MRRLTKWLLAMFLLAGLLVVIVVNPSDDEQADAGAVPSFGAPREETFYGPALRMGDGDVRIYAQLRDTQPISLGFAFTRNALVNLPTARSDGKYCYDQDDNSRIDPNTECVAEHEFVLDLPAQFAARVGGPFTWALLTWDPYGHAPDQIYGVPHFDFHFYIQDRVATEAIRSGPCGGLNLVNCDDYQTGRIPVPARYNPSGYVDIDAIVPGMGNHLGDPESHEFHGGPFTHSFLYGAYGGSLTFYEPMIAKSWLDQLVDNQTGSCTPIKEPAAWQVAGWYPTTYCIEYQPAQQEFTVSMRDFVLRPAS